MNVDLLRQLNQRPIAYYPAYRRLTGSTTSAVLLSQLMYWFSKKDKIYKTDADIMSETMLSQNELRTAKNKIKKLKFIKITLEGLPRKSYYHIDWEIYEASIVESTSTLLVDSTNTDTLNSQCCDSEFNSTITESTTEIKTENTTKKISPQPPKGESVEISIKEKPPDKKELKKTPHPKTSHSIKKGDLQYEKWAKALERKIQHANPPTEGNPIGFKFPKDHIIKWSKTFKEIFEIEGYSEEFVKETVEAVFDDEFYSKGLTSAKKLQDRLHNNALQAIKNRTNAKSQTIQRDLEDGPQKRAQNQMNGVKAQRQREQEEISRKQNDFEAEVNEKKFDELPKKEKENYMKMVPKYLHGKTTKAIAIAYYIADLRKACVVCT